MKKLLFLAIFTLGLSLNSHIVAQEDIEGEKAKCEVRWGVNQGIYNCKYQIAGNVLNIYLDTEDNRTIAIAPEQLMFFPTAKQYEWKGKIFRHHRLLSNIDIYYRDNSDPSLANRSNKVSLYLEHNITDDEQPAERQQLAEFFNSRQLLNEDEQHIASQLEYLQAVDSPASSQEEAIDRLFETYECVRCDLSGVDLTGEDLQDVNLEGANLQNAILTDANLEGAYLLGANLDNALLDGVSLRAADLPYTSLVKVNLEEADLSGANLQKTNLSEAILAGAEISSFTNLKQANLQNADLFEARLEGVDLSGANLAMADLEGAEIAVAELVEDTVSWDYWIFLRSNLSQANLEGANLIDTKFKGADLNQANLQNAQAEGVDFDNDNVRGRNVPTILCEATMPDGGVSQDGCDIDKVSLPDLL